MERAIGEVFEYEGKKLVVSKERSYCVGCYFRSKCPNSRKTITGLCGRNREDGIYVIFQEVQE